MEFFVSPTLADQNADSSSASHFLQTVVLREWWLIKAAADDEVVFPRKSLGVAGFTSRDQQAVRAFSSAPILKSYDVFTLETVDGITILLKGFINKLRTKENGFPDEVFKHFVFGFPPYWEVYMEKFLEGGSGDDDVSRSAAAPEKLSADTGGCNDFNDGTPNRKRKAPRNSRAANCDENDLSETVKQSANTNAKRVLRSSSRLSDANQSFVAGRGDFCEGTPNKTRKTASKLSNTNCDYMDLSQGSEGSKSTKRKLRSSSRHSDANQCLDVSRESTSNEEQKLVNRSRIENCDKKGLSQAGKDRKNTKSVFRSFSGLSDVSQKPGFRGEDRKRESNAREEACNSKKKTRRKLAYGRSPATEGGANIASSVSPELSSLKKSRSGRKLLPALEFWRNQTAIYDMERKLTCIKFRSPTTNQSTG